MFLLRILQRLPVILGLQFKLLNMGRKALQNPSFVCVCLPRWYLLYHFPLGSLCSNHTGCLTQELSIFLPIYLLFPLPEKLSSRSPVSLVHSSLCSDLSYFSKRGVPWPSAIKGHLYYLSSYPGFCLFVCLFGFLKILPLPQEHQFSPVICFALSTTITKVPETNTRHPKSA